MALMALLFSNGSFIYILLFLYVFKMFADDFIYVKKG